MVNNPRLLMCSFLTTGGSGYLQAFSAKEDMAVSEFIDLVLEGIKLGVLHCHFEEPESALPIEIGIEGVVCTPEFDNKEWPKALMFLSFFGFIAVAAVGYKIRSAYRAVKNELGGRKHTPQSPITPRQATVLYQYTCDR